MHPVWFTNTHHVAADLVNHGMVKNTKAWISLEQNIAFLQCEKILYLCLRWHILRSYCFVVELAFYVKYTVIKYFRHYDVTVGQLNCRISRKNWQAFLSFSCRSSSQIEKNCCMLRHLHACLEIWQVLSFTDESNDPTTLGFGETL